MSIAIIAAVGRNNELGKNNDLIWHFRQDMQFFKQTTTGATVIMGRRTFESLPKALPNRRNLVITANANYQAEGAEVVGSVDAALEALNGENAFIIGGASVYKAFLPLANTLILTEIDAVCADADTYFPAFDKGAYTREVIGTAEENGVAFSFVKYTKN
ncbi:MAG: dihydrofolate reductase [Ruminococcaceae bacterium]|nr:dihydrofolate reductase [Oscillospiraceae bacterium]